MVTVVKVYTPLRQGVLALSSRPPLLCVVMLFAPSRSPWIARVTPLMSMSASPMTRPLLLRRAVPSPPAVPLVRVRMEPGSGRCKWP